MKIAVLSGKGGTGKTLLSVNLASVADNAEYIDCDVEEPNGYLFFKPENIEIEKVNVKIPEVNQELCNGCRKCVDFCKYNALAYINEKLVIFDDICHSCSGCTLFCPQNALTEKEKNIGEIQRGISNGINITTGIMNTGEASGTSIIKNILKEDFNKKDITIIDSPPGSACIVMETIKDVDYCILVAEPTLFGVHNLNMVHELVNLFGKSYGVVLNKDFDGKNPAEDFCLDNNIKILGRIPFDSELGKINSEGIIAARENEKYKKIFSNILQRVIKEVEQGEAIINS
ncbi:ATP-binding protein [Clostridium sp. D2Q-14]|uniref:nucleotide-binding protein n=1 Tax=Anaeromonas gelatinilytica TaxID=2683194 RepID=UPI00193B8190|nr:ATP-binding protein [Anaeromonas gelatinilytica]MBS4534156.1 ATP-binding protein [Anaeromonas gelatinilytica]